jgi:PAS domain S-box-containing protein
VAVYEAIRDGEDFTFTDINPAGLDLAGLERDQVIGRPVAEVFPGVREMGLLEVLRRVWRTGTPAHVPATHYADARLSHWYENHVYKLPSGEIVAIYDDVTRRMEAQAALRASEERFRSLFEQAPLGYQSLDAEGRFIEVNQVWTDMLGYAGKDVVGKWFGDFLAPEYVDAFRERFPQFKAAGKVHAEYQMLHRDGRRRFIAFEGRIAHRPDGSFQKTHCILTDVTDRKRAEEALAAHYALLRIAGRTAALGGWSVELAEDRVIWSDEVAAIHDMPAGYSPPIEEGISFYAPEWRSRIAKVFGDCAERGIPYDEIMEIVTAQGRRRWVRTIGEAIRDEAGKIVKVQGAFQDITEQRAAEDERDRLQAQLNQMQKIESVGRLAGGVAHDFNNMLGTILGHAEMALDGLPADAPLHAHLLEIQRAAERSAGLTRQLLAFARKQTVVPKILDLNETVAGMLQMLRRLIGENVELAWLPGRAVGPIKIDPSQLDQILTNLCVNARDAIAGDGQIAIETAPATFTQAIDSLHPGQPPGEYVLLAVRDNGCGMDPETLGRLFEPFFTTKEVGQGTGLGLPTVYGIVKQNGGFIDVDSAPGGGSTFKIYLPRHGNLPAPATAAAPTPPAVGGRETVLLVEDEPAILAISREMLKNLGYHVLSATTPGEALQQAKAQTGEIQLLITDVVMPEMNGRDLAQQLAVLHPGIRRLFMSGYTADIIAHHGVLDDDVHFIQKPFTLKELAAKVREILNG